MTVFVHVFQDYGLDVNAFRKLVTDCPQRLLDLSANCCMVGRQNMLKNILKTYKKYSAVQKQGNNIVLTFNRIRLLCLMCKNK